MKKFFDLRFVIGIFFLVVGAMLFAYSFIYTPPPEYAYKHVNLYTAIVFLVFAIFMIIVARDKKPKDQL